MSGCTTYLVEPGNIGRGGVICIGRDIIANQVCDLERGTYSGSGCAWLEAIATLGLDIRGDHGRSVNAYNWLLEPLPFSTLIQIAEAYGALVISP
jgi:hypothetical protein